MPAGTHPPTPANNNDSSTRATLLFSVGDGVGVLDSVLHVLSALNISLTRIESRPSKTLARDYDFFVDFDAPSQTALQAVLAKLADSAVVKQVRLISSRSIANIAVDGNSVDQAPWFPRKMADLDSFAEKVLSYGAELDADHPGFTDKTYRARRASIIENARTYKTGQPLPRVEYTEAEVQTWGQVYNQLTALFKKHACREHRYIFPLLEANCGYRSDNIPQIEDVSRFLKDCTGFILRPVMGLLSSRDFLNGLAFRVFHSTQYIRHHSSPFYTPEPDVCHELLGHVPLFVDPEFADFSQEIGLASLGASDDDIKKLSTIYWFTVEFGMCREDDQVKAYGAGLLSSFGELEHCVSSVPERRPFDLNQMAIQKYPITEFQPIYFVAESFKDMKEKVKDYAAGLQRPFVVRYNPYSETIEVLDSKEKLVKYAQSIKGSMHTMVTALEKL